MLPLYVACTLVGGLLTIVQAKRPDTFSMMLIQFHLYAFVFGLVGWIGWIFDVV